MMVSTSRETTLQIILRLTPRDHRETHDPKNRYRMICPVCNYIPRGGGFTTFSIQDNQNQWYCFACGNGGGPREMLGHLSGAAPLDVRLPQISWESGRKPGQGRQLQGARLKQLCRAKGLDEQWCRGTLGWRDGYWYRTPAVEMPYYTESGSEGTVRYRVGINSQDRFRTRGKQILYGLWDLSRIRQAAWVIIVEGETDFATLYYHGFPVLGVPGSSMWRQEHAQLLQGVQVYVWHEADTGGNTLVNKVGSTIPGPLIINAPEAAKDANDLYRVAGPNFGKSMDELLGQARQEPADWDRPSLTRKHTPTGSVQRKQKPRSRQRRPTLSGSVSV